MRADRGAREAKALTKALAPYRSGLQGALRAQVRCMLVRLMGFANCDDIPVGIRKIPHWFPHRSGLSEEELQDLQVVAYDALLELGYEAAAALLTRFDRDMSMLPVSAKDALANLEGGPPSVIIDHWPIITKTIRRYRVPDGSEYLVGRNVNDPRWWYRFVRGKAVHNQRGQREAGYTFQRRGDSLEDVLGAKHSVLGAKYGSIALL